MGYIPDSDSEFDVWQAHFIEQADAGDLGSTVQGLAGGMKAAQVKWNQGYEAHIDAQDAAKAATANKDETRTALIAKIRVAAQIAQTDPEVTNQQRAAAGLPVYKTGRTPAPVPTTRPVANVDTSQRLTHVIHFRDEASTGKAKPKGVQGAEVWVKVGDAAPASTDELHFLGLDTRTPYTAHYEMEDAGKTAYYMLRWVNTRSEPGPWSETVEATIGG